MKLLLRIAYDGRYYCGFQAQKNGRSVQERLTEVLSGFFGTPCAVTGCSRTDAGVHARGFCCTVAPVNPMEPTEPDADWWRIPPGKLHHAVNRMLMPHMAVNGACVVPDAFHPRYDVRDKTYAYRIYDTPADDPFAAPYTWHVRKSLSAAGIDAMQNAAQTLLGTHDFSAYMATGSKITDPTRTIVAARVRREADGIVVFRVTADGFLYNMVRILAGTLYEIGIGQRSAELAAITESRDRRLAGVTAPPEGLTLEEVRYPDAWQIRWLCE